MAFLVSFLPRKDGVQKMSFFWYSCYLRDPLGSEAELIDEMVYHHADVVCEGMEWERRQGGLWLRSEGLAYSLWFDLV